jgi:hypothetical protein
VKKEDKTLIASVPTVVLNLDQRPTIKHLNVIIT